MGLFFLTVSPDGKLEHMFMSTLFSEYLSGYCDPGARFLRKAPMFSLSLKNTALLTGY